MTVIGRQMRVEGGNILFRAEQVLSGDITSETLAA